MAKKNGHVEAVAETVETTEAVEAVVAAPDKGALRDLLVEYEAADLKIVDAEKALEAAKQEQSNIVQKISLAAGNKKKIRFRNEEATIVSRKNNKTHVTNFHLRGKSRDGDALDLDLA